MLRRGAFPCALSSCTHVVEAWAGSGDIIVFFSSASWRASMGVVYTAPLPELPMLSPELKACPQQEKKGLTKAGSQALRSPAGLWRHTLKKEIQAGKNITLRTLLKNLVWC